MPSTPPDPRPAERPDPFLFDAEQLRELASDPIVRRGMGYFRENRVMDLRWDRSRMTAVVEGSDPDLPYALEMLVEPDGELSVDCSCPFDWEPTCKHAVAALLAYAARQPVPEVQVKDAAGQAVEDRARAGRTQVSVKHVAGDPTFGTWHARSEFVHGKSARTWRVQIRSVTERINQCDCPDFATNRLGTCKHVEAVLHHLRTRSKTRYRRAARSGPPIPFVHLAWDEHPAPQVRLRRPAGLDPELAGLLDAHFDSAGALRGPLPGALLRFAEAVAGRDDVLLGDDALAHARRLGEDAAHRERAARLRELIGRSGSRLEGVAARLYPYQVEGVAFLASNGRALLADDMGLGKTLQAIGAARLLMDREGVRRVLVVCPASLKHQWAREIERFAGLDVQVVQGNAAARRVQYRRQAPFSVINYELVLRDRSVLTEDLAPDLLVLDEAQRIKNWRTKTADAIKRIPTRYAFVLSGTPLENRLEDLYSVMQVVDSGVLGPLWRYLLDFHVTSERGKVLGYRNLSELRRRLAPVMLRREKTLVRDQLPDRIVTRLDVPLTARQQELHDGAMQTMGKYARILRRRPLTPSEEHRLLAAMQTARMACDAAGLVDKETKGAPKLDELARLFEELCVEGGRKMVVFSEWERMTAMAEEVARRLGLGTVRLHGGVPTARRGALLDRFREDPAAQVFLSTDAGGVGLNLQAASVVVNLDMPWNPAVLEQRNGRVHRLGQTEPVQVVLMLGADSYEQQVFATASTKRELFDNVVADEATEDVVGLSKRLVEALAEQLGEDEDEEEERAAQQAVPGEEPVEEAAAGEEPAEEEAVEAAVPGKAPQVEVDAGPALEALQAALGTRLERVLVSAGGLLAVVDEVDGRAEVAAVTAEAALDGELPVAVIDARTAVALGRLGSGTPLAQAQVAWEPEPEATAPSEPPLVAEARRKLDAAGVLLDGGCPEEALGLVARASLATLALRADRSAPPALREAPVWVFGDLVPGGVLTPEEGTVLARTLALAEADNVPAVLVRQALEDARGLLERRP